MCPAKRATELSQFRGRTSRGRSPSAGEPLQLTEGALQVRRGRARNDRVVVAETGSASGVETAELPDDRSQVRLGDHVGRGQRPGARSGVLEALRQRTGDSVVALVGQCGPGVVALGGQASHLALENGDPNGRARGVDLDVVRVSDRQRAPQELLLVVRDLALGCREEDLQCLARSDCAGGAGSGPEGPRRRAGAVGGLGVRAGCEGLRVFVVRHDGGELVDQVLLELTRLGRVGEEGGEVSGELVAGLIDTLVGSGSTLGGVEHGVLLGQCAETGY